MELYFMLLYYYGNIVLITRRETNAVADSLARQAVHENKDHVACLGWLFILGKLCFWIFSPL
ncbi:hypothetical protein NC653_036775 [Populus alba x Populus x berolinensis]|uniref:Uncharacterized protein n=1 Tax=Populus alba x Populus x berolinensis TaxID=444605 RepID=A0AAD6LKN4_9ROSI|nr:hypothetical protein NC653_036775 [Populus alba x Populus x berolinensis]